MKQSPHLIEVEALMAPGALTREGFLGQDGRSLLQILTHDDNKAASLGFTHEELGEVMERYSSLALAAMGAPTWEGDICVRGYEAMGQMPCPFAHPGLYPKAIINARRDHCEHKLQWAALSAHLIRAHGFYGGLGSIFRIEPEEAASFFRLI